MKTLVIWDTIEEPMKWFIIDEDWTRFNNIYINSVEDDELQQELCSKMWPKSQDEGIVFLARDFPIDVKENQPEFAFIDHIITCGFLPYW